MYKFLIAALLISFTAGAQVKEGKVIYERKMNMHKDMPPEAEQFKAMIPEFQTSKMELIFNATQSLFHPQPGAEEEDQLPQTGGDGGRRMNFRIGGMDAESFRDYDKEQLVESRDLGPKKYIIEDSLVAPKWKLEEDTLRILGYLCHKATTAQPNLMRRRPGFVPGGDSTQAPPADVPVTVWYTEEIETQAGPDNLFGLPGLILGVSVNNGTLVYKALSIEPAADKDLVKAPTNGKKITREEYRKMMQEQFRSMGGRGAGGGQVIRIQQ